MTAKIGDIVVSKRSGRHYKIIRVRRRGAYEAEYVEDPGYPVFFDDDQITTTHGDAEVQTAAVEPERREYKVTYTQMQRCEIVVWASSADDAEHMVRTEDLHGDNDFAPFDVIDWAEPEVEEVVEVFTS